MSTPSIDRVRELSQVFDEVVKPDYIDENRHMNITEYFKFGTWAPWLRMAELGIGEKYIEERGLSFFTVEHHIKYLGELRLDERFTVHTGLVDRTHKAVQLVSYVVDPERDRVACALEVMYVHVDMTARKSVPIPDDIAELIDGDLATHPWLRELDHGLSLRR